jgi:two-component system, cell cycle sensor histidine kinase and response regulator CckA
VNARDAMPDGGRLSVTTRAVTAPHDHRSDGEPGPFLLLTVSDTGVGMPPEVLERVFEPFFTTKPQGRGTGLGLSTVYGIVEQSGGFIRLDSEPGRGTRFEIYLPRTTEGAAVPTPCGTGAPRGAGVVLLVEDEAAVRSVTRRMLERFGYQVRVAENGDEAVRLLDEDGERVDLLITDVVMPGISGQEVAERARRRHPSIRVLFMSGYTDEAISRHGMLDEGVEFLHKPFSPETLAHRVSQVIGMPGTA